MSPSRPRVVFLGTPEAAVPSLSRLSEIADVIAVVTRPDRPRGRSGKPRPSPVKEAAVSSGYRIIEASRASDLRALRVDADLGVVVAFGVIIPPNVLALPKHGFLNVHFSLLPRWRGAAPVAAAIASGDEETGVSVMLLEEGLDTGPVIAAVPQVIGIDESAGNLTIRLSTAGASLLVESIPSFLAGRLIPIRQDNTRATYAPRLSTADRRLDLQQDPEINQRMVRALAPKPGAFLIIDGQQLGITAARAALQPLRTGVFEADQDRLLVGSNGRALELIDVHPSGRRTMSGRDWARGWKKPPTADT